MSHRDSQADAHPDGARRNGREMSADAAKFPADDQLHLTGSGLPRSRRQRATILLRRGALLAGVRGDQVVQGRLHAAFLVRNTHYK